MREFPIHDLSPKLKRPLSLWNPLDYFLLLYWVFYFPQAIRWYIETFCETETDSDQLSWLDRWSWIKDSFYVKQLVIMTIFLLSIIPLLFCFFMRSIGIQVYWLGSMVSIVIGLIAVATMCIANDMAMGIAIGVAIGVVLSSTVGVAGDMANNISNVVFQDGAESILSSVIVGIAYGTAIGLVVSVAMAIVSRMNFNVKISICSRTLLWLDIIFVGLTVVIVKLLGLHRIESFLIIGDLSKIVLPLGRMFANITAFFLALNIVILRLDNLFFVSPRITLLRIPRISRLLSTSLETNWQGGLINANQFLKYSQQFLAVDDALNKVLDHTQPNLLIERMSTLADLICDWDVLFYISASLKRDLSDGDSSLRFDTSVQIAAAGFWYLQEEATEKQWIANGINLSNGISLSASVQAFAKLRHIEHGEEMYQLAFILHALSQVFTIQDIASLNLSPFTYPVLRPTVWDAINKLILVVEDARVVRRSTSRIKRSFALNHALGLVIEVLSHTTSLPIHLARIEHHLIQRFSTSWHNILLFTIHEIGQIEIDKPIANPYTIGDPVFGSHFVGREDILRQLEELWLTNRYPQSVILYSPRRTGKTSILRNAAMIDSQVCVAYVNLLSIGSAPKGITDILMAICDALEEVTEIPAPNNDDIFQFPEATFRRHLQYIEKNFIGTGLIIALDEFEKIEELIDAGKLSKDFLGFLRGMVQMSSKLAFAFAGLHTLQEMNADYFQPFYASFIPIRVTFLSRDATHQILANPDPEFLLEYEPNALDHIYDLTNGQPYLTQLIGFQLVRMFNDYVFEQGKPRDRTFTIDDVRTICSGENFFNTGINYFNGVWQQASEGAAHQQDILKALAPHPQGLTEPELISQTNLSIETLQAALKTLKDHDVIRSQKTNEIVNWAIAVELFRTWVAKYKLSHT
jgi:hypothetical protein